MKSMISLTLWLAMCMMLGCQPKVGGRLSPVYLHSMPEGATAYVVPLDDWQDQLRDQGCCASPTFCCEQLLCADNAFLRAYRVRSGLTSAEHPLRVELRAHVHVYIAELGTSREWTQFNPDRDRNVTLMLHVDESEE
jgi:hypothetical protein